MQQSGVSTTTPNSSKQPWGRPRAPIPNTLNSELYVTGRGGMAKDGQVTLDPTPWDSYSSVDYHDKPAWYDSIERDIENIFTTHTGYLEGRQIPAQTPLHPPDTPASWYQPVSAKHRCLRVTMVYTRTAPYKP
jgi:hypothetical protein